MAAATRSRSRAVTGSPSDQPPEHQRTQCVDDNFLISVDGQFDRVPCSRGR
jgi:hypothetical protein